MLGNAEILRLPKTAFLCSRQVPAEAVLRYFLNARQPVVAAARSGSGAKPILLPSTLN